MERVAGVAVGEQVRLKSCAGSWSALRARGRFEEPIYVADSKVRAIFIFDTETKDPSDQERRGSALRVVTGLAIDDSDRLFVADSEMKRVMIFDPQHVEGSISEGWRVRRGGDR